jgi:hypothetical protein
MLSVGKTFGGFSSRISLIGNGSMLRKGNEIIASVTDTDEILILYTSGILNLNGVSQWLVRGLFHSHKAADRAVLTPGKAALGTGGINTIIIYLGVFRLFYRRVIFGRAKSAYTGLNPLFYTGGRLGNRPFAVLVSAPDLTGGEGQRQSYQG